MDKVSEKVRELFVKSFHLEPDEVTDEAELRRDLEMDSTEVVELVVALEQEFNIKIADGEVTNRQKFGDVVQTIRSKLAS
jgi:acyl carrier protein